jgi:uncharacterized membrane protein
MYLLFLGITVILIWVNLAGLALAVTRWIPHYAIAKTAGVLGLCLGLFFIEHFYGFGNLYWVWPLTTAASVWCLYQKRDQLKATAWNELPFVLSFLYIFAWRFGFPDIYPSSERITDLYFISNYLPGTTLPPVDNWFPPYTYSFYYSLQFYGAALLGRIFGVEVGVTYQLSFCVIFALGANLVWWVAAQLVPRPAPRVLLAVALILGGTGVSPFMPWLVKNETPQNIDTVRNHDHMLMWAGTRFIGDSDGLINTEVGKELFPMPKGPDGKVQEVPELPLETFGYYGYLGDYHPPLSSFLLLFLAIACMVWLESAPLQRVPQILLAASVPLMLASNAWLFPLQVLLIGAWVVYRYLRRTPPDWVALIGAGLAGFVLLYPFLTYFSTHALSTPIRLILPGFHSPIGKFLGLHWPLLILLGVVLCARRERPLARFFGVTFLLLYILSEIIFVDDGSVNRYERTNTLMKWWGWLFAGAALTWGAMALSALSPVRRWLGVIALAVLASYSVMLVRFWVISDKHNMGKFHGHYWITNDPTERALLSYLRAAPAGIVLESKINDAYNRNPLLTINAGKTALLGWVHHLSTWGRDASPLMGRAWAVENFYKGEKADALDWLVGNDVRYVVWNAGDNQQTPGSWPKIHGQISPRYYWHEFYAGGDSYRVGIWVRKPE